MAKSRYTPPIAVPPSISLADGQRQLRQLLERAHAILVPHKLEEAKFTTWSNMTQEVIEKTFGSRSEHVNSFANAGQITVVGAWGSRPTDWNKVYRDELTAKVAVIESLVDALDFQLSMSTSSTTGAVSDPAAEVPKAVATKEVFIVHGHDEATKAKVARFLEHLGLVPVILHEQPDCGQTIIEKLERHALGVAFAVVLLTPDDVGAAKQSATTLFARARQNVILEMGYFISKLGRSKVCPLYSKGVELPSDLFGVIYTPLEEHDAWQLKLARELKAAGLDVDMNRL